MDAKRRVLYSMGQPHSPSPHSSDKSAAWPELPGEVQALQRASPQQPLSLQLDSPGEADMDLANTTTNLTGLFKPGSPAVGRADLVSHDLIDLAPTPPRGAPNAAPHYWCPCVNVRLALASQAHPLLSISE